MNLPPVKYQGMRVLSFVSLMELLSWKYHQRPSKTSHSVSRICCRRSKSKKGIRISPKPTIRTTTTIIIIITTITTITTIP
jgi:hypothetical protein